MTEKETDKKEEDMLQKLDQLIQQKKKEIASLQNLLGSIGKQNPIEKKPEEKTGNPEQE